MRLFVALDIDAAVRGRISRFVEGARAFAPRARWVRPDSLHVTLKFIGEQSEQQLIEIKRALETVEAGQFEIRIHGYGFFPNADMPRVFWTGIEAGSELSALAAAVDETLMKVGIAREKRPFTPHLTLARTRSGSAAPHRQKDDRANRDFQPLQEHLSALPAPEFGTIAAREYVLFQSQLSPEGSKYSQLARFPLH